MNYEEFLTPERNSSDQQDEAKQKTSGQVTMEVDETVEHDLDVQKAVVESLAADKAEQDETISKLREEVNALQTEVSVLKQKIEEQKEALGKVGDVLAKNSETPQSNKIALLDRDVEIPDRFPGETRDQVLEAIKEAKEKADSEGRIRRAQLLEGVLLANEPSGNLEKKRLCLEKFFRDNQNILSGSVIAELKKYGISYKKGEEYLLPSEILKRTY